MDAPSHVPHALRPPVILVVDDEPEIVLTLGAAFRRALPDARVLKATHGQEALGILERERVDLVLSDHCMPGMQGLDLLAQARRLQPEVASVLMTAFPDMDLAIRGINERTLDRFLTKPFRPKEVVETITDLLEAQRARRMRAMAFERSSQILRDRLERMGAPS